MLVLLINSKRKGKFEEFQPPHHEAHGSSMPLYMSPWSIPVEVGPEEPTDPPMHDMRKTGKWTTLWINRGEKTGNRFLPVFSEINDQQWYCGKILDCQSSTGTYTSPTPSEKGGDNRRDMPLNVRLGGLARQGYLVQYITDTWYVWLFINCLVPSKNRSRDSRFCYIIVRSERSPFAFVQAAKWSAYFVLLSFSPQASR